MAAPVEQSTGTAASVQAEEVASAADPDSDERSVSGGASPSAASPQEYAEGTPSPAAEGAPAAASPEGDDDAAGDLGALVDTARRSVGDEQAAGDTEQAATLSPEDFLVSHELGRGEFGQVLSVLRKGGRRAYAMKVQSKQAVLSRKRVYLRMLQDEVRVLALPPSPFLARLAYCFQDSQVQQSKDSVKCRTSRTVVSPWIAQ